MQYAKANSVSIKRSRRLSFEMVSHGAFTGTIDRSLPTERNLRIQAIVGRYRATQDRVLPKEVYAQSEYDWNNTFPFVTPVRMRFVGSSSASNREALDASAAPAKIVILENWRRS